MSWKWLSFLASGRADRCIVGLYLNDYKIFGRGPVTISFTVQPTPTAGGLAMTGPYRYLRHPIYAAILYFFGAGIAAHPSPGTVEIGLLATALTARCEL